MNVAIMLILLEAEKLCVILDVIRFFILLCAYTDYYDHCDYYDDGNFFHNSPLLHSLVSTMQLWCYYIINTIVWLSLFLRSVLRMIRIHTYTHTQTHAKDITKCQRNRSFQTINMYNTKHQCSTRFHQKCSFSGCYLMLFTLETPLRSSSSFINQENWLIDRCR